MAPKSRYLIAVLAIFFAIACIVSFSAAPFFNSIDTYLNAREANTYWTGEHFPVPIFTPLYAEPSDAYLLYHLTMAPFTAFFHGDNYQALIDGSKLCHSVIFALIFCVFFLLAYEIVKSERYAFIATVGLFMVSMLFSYRLFFARPSVVAILFSLGIFYLVYSKKHVALFIASLAFPFFYSITPFVLIYPLAYGIAYKDWKPLFIVFGGLIAGILLRPDTLSYIHDYYLPDLQNIINTSFRGFIGSDELVPYRNPAREIWFIPTLLTLGYYVVRMVRGKTWRAVSPAELCLFLLTGFYCVLFLFLQRAIEYVVPCAVLLFTVFVARIKDGPWLVQKRHLARVVSRVAAPVIAALLILYTGVFMAYAKTAPDLSSLEGVTGYLTTHSNRGDAVFSLDTNSYAQLVFFDTYNNYSLGIDPALTYSYSPALYEDWKRMVLGEESHPFDVIKQDFNPRYVLIEKDDHYLGVQTFNVWVESDPRFKLIYSDDAVALYEL